MGWEIVFFVLAIAFASKVGAKALVSELVNRRRAKAERRAHRSQLVTEAINKGMAPKQAKAAADAAARAAVTVSSWTATWIALKNGWLKGWKEGRERGARLRTGTEPHESATAGPPANDFVGPNQAALCEFHFAETDAAYRWHCDNKLCIQEIETKSCDAGHEIPTFCGKQVTGEDTLLCDIHQGAAAAECKTYTPAYVQGTPTRGAGIDRQDHAEQPSSDAKAYNETEEKHHMAIETGAVTGEILNKEQFEAAMKAIIAEEIAEIEDANGDLKRAQERTQQIEVMAASLASAEIDKATVISVRKFIDGSSSRLQDAQRRVANAELRKADAESALTTLTGSKQNQFYSA